MIIDNEKRLRNTIKNLEMDIISLKSKIYYLETMLEIKEESIKRQDKRIEELVNSYCNYIHTGKVEFPEDKRGNN